MNVPGFNCVVIPLVTFWVVVVANPSFELKVIVFKLVEATHRMITTPEPPAPALISSGSVPPPPPPVFAVPAVGFVY